MAGGIGIVAGAVVLIADVSTTFLLAIIGIVIGSTGVVHLLGGFETADLLPAGGGDPASLSGFWRSGWV